MSDIPTTEPNEIRAGTTVSWQRNDLSADYPASSYTLKYYLVNASVKITITASANGDNYQVSLAKATTAAYTVGKYEWSAVVDNGTVAYEIDKGTIEILTDYSAAGITKFDYRTSAQTIYEAVSAVIEGRATQDQESYSIQGRALSKTPIADLLLLRSTFKSIWEKEKTAERLKNGGESRNRIKVRFTGV